jgi:signal transduction histidine kinase
MAETQDPPPEPATVDAKERRRAEAALQFLADASAALAESLDYQVTLQQILDLAVPFLADWCTVDLLDEAGVMRRVAAGHRDPAAQELLHRVREQHEEWASPHASAEILAAGKAVLFPEVTEAVLETFVKNPEIRAVVKALGVASGMAVPLRARGRPIGAMTFSSNTPGRRYDAADLALAQELGRRAAVAVDNARLYQQAQQAVRLRDEFLSVASHQLNTPIAALQLLVDGLNEGPIQQQAEHLERTVGILTRQTRRLGRLISQLLDVVQVQAGLFTLRREPVDLAAVVHEVAQRFGEELARARCALTVHAPGPVPGQWDRARLAQVVGHLLSNAVTFGAGKPIEVVVEELPGDQVRLVVEDHGIGIPPERLSHVFGRFERAAPVSHYGGLGLGLFLVKEIVEALQGSVSVESALGAGARFTVQLPRTPRPAPPGEPGAPSGVRR